jgi:hypothetical protein
MNTDEKKVLLLFGRYPRLSVFIRGSELGFPRLASDDRR